MGGGGSGWEVMHISISSATSCSSSILNFDTLKCMSSPGIFCFPCRIAFTTGVTGSGAGCGRVRGRGVFRVGREWCGSEVVVALKRVKCVAPH